LLDLSLVIPEPELASYLRRYWGLGDVRITAHNGGMGSATWFIDHEGSRWVAKAVAPDAGSQFAGGLELARCLEQAGIPAGAPVPTADGQLAVDVGAGWLAVLTWAPGHPLSGESGCERELIGTTLARVHRALAGHDAGGAQRFHWVDPDADRLSLRPWLRQAITAALDALDAADPATMSWGLLHADPAPEAFRLDPATGLCGVIDWSYFLYGPLLYDLASAVMYVGGPGRAGELVEAYLRLGVLDRAEVEHGLAPMLRFRWAVQADYFAWRIAENDLTGIDGPHENEKGLEDARRFLSYSPDGLSTILPWPALRPIAPVPRSSTGMVAC
jgi:Ser/Thr protein kinase RdoA (MazF antagonist)